MHSIDDVNDLRCWPISPAMKGIEAGTLKLVGRAPEHPAVRLQRVKERRGIADVHVGLNRAGMEGMLQLLDEAAEAGESYAPYAAAEIRMACRRSPVSEEQKSLVEARVASSLRKWDGRAGGSRRYPS